VAAGCGGGRAGFRNQEVEELRFQNARREEELRRAEEVVRLLKTQAAALSSERDALLAQVSDLKTQARAQRQGMDQLEVERGAAEERHRQATERGEELKKTLERVTSLLGLVGDEVAALRAELRGMEASTRRPGGQAEDLDFIEKSALISAKIEQLHFEILRERALLGAFSKPRAAASAPQPRETAPEPVAATSPAPPVEIAAAAPFPRPRTEPEDTAAASEPREEEASREPGIWARVGGAIQAAWQWLPRERIGKLVEMAVLIMTVALGFLALALVGRRLFRRLRGAVSRILASFRRRPARDLDIEEEPGAEGATAAKEDGDAAPIEPIAAASEEVGPAGPEPGAQAEIVPAVEREPAGAPDTSATETADAPTDVVAESADFFRAFQKATEKEPPRAPPPGPVARPAREAQAAKPPKPRPAARRPAVQPPPPTPVEEEPPRGAEDASPGATQTIEPADLEAGRGEGGTQVIPEAGKTEWELTQEIPDQGAEDFMHTQVISQEPREDFLSTQVIPAVPEMEGPRPRDLFPPVPDEDTAPTQVIREPEGLKGPEWPGEKGKTAGTRPPPRQRVEKKAPPRKQPPSDKALLAELEELIGRKIDEPTT
jgi:hypothetical protein